MHLRRIASFLLGAWLIGSLFAIYISTNGAASVERVIAMPTPEIGKMVTELHPDRMKLLLSYHSGEQVRMFLHDWARIQWILGPLLVLVLVRAHSMNRLVLGVCGAMFIFAVFADSVLMPELDYLSRALQFQPGWSANRARYLALHLTYTVLESLKIAMGLGVAAYLFTYKPRQRPVSAPEEHEAGAVEVRD